MALTIEFSRRSTNQLQKILTFYDERNGSDDYSRRLLLAFSKTCIVWLRRQLPAAFPHVRMSGSSI
jgi:hypothetical protein